MFAAVSPLHPLSTCHALSPASCAESFLVYGEVHLHKPILSENGSPGTGSLPPTFPNSPLPRMAPQSPQPQVDERPISPTPGTSQPMMLEEQLDEDVLVLLGDAHKTDTVMGPAIHQDIANRWQDILAKGLAKDVKESLLKTYLIPSNCELLIASALSSGVKAALTETSIKRDSSLLFK
ncbi:unnamed protein product [Parnassius apollo]|uniref:(apollo) hypothetical protein n=1 Tax=Parnassius apollo TaxID=110799 RepID=A0A8S3W7E2_PARAO|nr:unnamed protein product [Parnassius apollo]